MAVGLLESFELYEEYGKSVLSLEEMLFMAEIVKKRGCRCTNSKLTEEEVRHVMSLGRKCKKWKEGLS